MQDRVLHKSGVGRSKYGPSPAIGCKRAFIAAAIPLIQHVCRNPGEHPEQSTIVSSMSPVSIPACIDAHFLEVAVSPNAASGVG